MASTALFFDIFGRDRGVSSMLDNVAGRADNTNQRLGGVHGGLAKLGTVAGAAIVSLGGVAIGFGQVAADAEQNMGAVETVFGSAAGKVEDFASRSADAVGMSGSQYNQLSAVIGTALKAAGVPVDQLAEKNQKLIERGADMSSVFGGTAVEAVQAMGSAFRGEFDPLERYGVTLTMNKVNAELAARGQDKLGGAALEAAKKQAIMDLILKESSQSAGNFAKESDTASGAQQRATAAFSDAAAELGSALLPAMSAFAGIARDVATWVKNNAGLVTNLAVVLGVLAGGIAAVTAVQWVLNVAMAANPIGLVILAVAGLIAVIVLLAANWDHIVRFLQDSWANFTRWWGDGMNKLGGQWNGFWSGVGRTTRNTWNGVAGFFTGAWTGFTRWWNDGMNRVGSQWNGLWSGVGTFLRNTWNGTLGPVFNTVKDAVTKTIPNAFRDGVGFVRKAWDGLQEAAKSPVRFIINTVINDGLIGAFNTVAGWIPGVSRLGRVSIPGFATGGYTGDGGVNEPKGVVHGGEFVFTKKQTARAGVSTLAQLARTLEGFAGGGYVNPLKSMHLTQGYNRVHKGIDLAASVGTPVFATQDGTVSWAGPGARAPGVWGGNEVHIRGGGIETWFAHLSRIMVGLGQQIRAGQRIGLSGNTGITSGPHLHFGTFRGGWPNDFNPLSYLSGAGVPAGGMGAFNPIAGLIDGLMGGFRKAFPAGALVADLAAGVGKKLLTDVSGAVGKVLGFGSAAGGALRPKVFDGGGWLDNVGGPQLVDHRQRKPDAMVPFDQWQQVVKHAGAGFNLDGYTLELNADATKATFRRIASDAASGAVREANDDIYRGRAR